MTQENFWILFSKKIAGEASPEELADLNQMMQEHPEWQYASHNLELLWQTNAPPDLPAEEDAFLLHTQRMKDRGLSLDGMTDPALEAYEWQNRRRRRKMTIIYSSLAAAASLTLLLFLFLPGLQNPQSETSPIARQVNEVSTRLGSKSKIQLPDGSTVWINAGSKITYDKSFGKNLREVTLSGEAFFDVVKDEERPFIIHALSIDIRVLGTAFNVKAYPEDEKTETSLIRGRIEVSFRSRPDDKIILSPNEKLVVDNGERTDDMKRNGEESLPVMAINKLKVNPRDSTIVETEWVENRLVFENETLREVAVKMERWYGVDIEIREASLEAKRFTGKFADESIEQAMEALTYSYPFHFERVGNKITIKR